MSENEDYMPIYYANIASPTQINTPPVSNTNITPPNTTTTGSTQPAPK